MITNCQIKSRECGKTTARALGIAKRSLVFRATWDEKTEYDLGDGEIQHGCTPCSGPEFATREEAESWMAKAVANG